MFLSDEYEMINPVLLLREILGSLIIFRQFRTVKMYLINLQGTLVITKSDITNYQVMMKCFLVCL